MGQVGSHVVMTKPGERANLSIPQHKELPLGPFAP
ncbi:MAG: type II toxin-antitoxin system HicA family toxin [Acidobacteriaceae bacterium]